MPNKGRISKPALPEATFHLEIAFRHRIICEEIKEDSGNVTSFIIGGVFLGELPFICHNAKDASQSNFSLNARRRGDFLELVHKPRHSLREIS